MNRFRFALELAPLLLVTCLVWAPTAGAAFFGQMTPFAPRAERGVELAGAYLGLATDVVGGTGQLRFGMNSPYWDIGLQGGMDKISGDNGPTEIGGQLDVKAALFHPVSDNHNFHFGGDVAAHVNHTGSVNGFGARTDFGFTVLPGLSILAPGEKVGQAFAAWGGFGVDWTHFGEIEGLTPSGTSTSNAKGLMRLGAGYDFSRDLGLAAEWSHRFETGGVNNFLMGVNFGISGRPAGPHMPH